MAQGSVEQRLKDIGIVLPAPSTPASNYTNCIEAAGLLFVASKGPSASGGVKPKGKLGREYTTQDGIAFARQVGLEILAVVQEYLGTLDRVKRVVRLQGFVNATPEFEEHHKVMDGCSGLMYEVFGDRGGHARTVAGAPSLRDNLPIVIESIFEIVAE